MPSRKVITAVVGKTDQVTHTRGGTSAVRFSTLPADDTAARAQEDLRASVDGLLKDTPFKTGALLDVEFTSSSLTQEIPHTLNASVQGFIVADVVEGAIIYRTDETSGAAITFSRSKTHIKLTATGPCKAKIWVWS